MKSSDHYPKDPESGRRDRCRYGNAVRFWYLSVGRICGFGSKGATEGDTTCENTHDYLKRKFNCRRAAAYFIAFMITFIFVDLFQVKESAQHGSFDNFNRYFANAYPECIPEGIGGIFSCLFSWTADEEPANESSPMVSVVLWTDEMLKASSKSWPLRMEEHARVLETILPLQPKAVLVDLFFLDDPENRGDQSLQDLVDVICDYQETSGSGTSTKLYLAGPNPEVDQNATRKLMDGVKEVCGLDLAEQKESDAVRITPAVLSNSPSRIYPKDGAAVKIFSPESGMEDFHIFWANSSDQTFLKNEKCERSNSLFPDGILGVLWEIAMPAIEKLPISDSFKRNSSAAVPCPYAPVISAHVMHCLRAIPLDDAVDSHLEEMEACGLTKNEYSIIKRNFKDKYVLYGAELHGLGDIYDVPVHDNYRLSGIFIHAMALDNLLKTKGNVHFIREKRGWIPTIFYYILSALLATILFFVMKYAFFDFWHRLQCCIQKKYIPRTIICRTCCRLLWLALEVVYWLILVITASLALLLIAWTVYLLAFLYEPFRFGVLNWIGILLVSGLLSIWAKIPFAEGLAEVCLTHQKKEKVGCHDEVKES